MDIVKAGYETGAGSYKHIYFNATWQTGAMWTLTLVSALLLYEASRYLLGVWIAGRLRWRMAILAIASIYPHYYGIWTLWGYFNDDFYEQVFYHDFNWFHHSLHLGSTSATVQFDRGT